MALESKYKILEKELAKKEATINLNNKKIVSLEKKYEKLNFNNNEYEAQMVWCSSKLEKLYGQDSEELYQNIITLGSGGPNIPKLDTKYFNDLLKYIKIVKNYLNPVLVEDLGPIYSRLEKIKRDLIIINLENLIKVLEKFENYIISGLGNENLLKQIRTSIEVLKTLKS